VSVDAQGRRPPRPAPGPLHGRTRRGWQPDAGTPRAARPL